MAGIRTIFLIFENTTRILMEISEMSYFSKEKMFPLCVVEVCTKGRESRLTFGHYFLSRLFHSECYLTAVFRG